MNNANVNVKRGSSPIFYILLLFVSFLWLNLYPTINQLGDFFIGYGNLFDFSNPNMTFIVSRVVIGAVVDTAIFELLFFVYQLILTRKVYFFVVPHDKFKVESRVFMFYRNMFLGILYNLCFLYAFLYTYALLFEILITLLVVILYAKHLAKHYSDPIIGHFVYKSFVYPLFIYEVITFILQLWMVV
ncbi:MAG: hypothetical protein IJ538_00050 [Clostridia bacterium]|nr:hypothetical protein [Clostridia bacterium]